jgi:hypothetical protein
MHQLFQVLCDIEDIDGITPASVGESKEWAAIISSTEENHESYCQALLGKPLFSPLYGTYAVTLNELKSVLKASSQAGQANQADGFKEVRCRKRLSTGEAAHTLKKVTMAPPVMKLATSNFFALFRTAQMDTDAPVAQPSAEEAAAPNKSARPPPIILTSAANLIQLQKKLKGVARQSFEFRNTMSATRVAPRTWWTTRQLRRTSTKTLWPTLPFSRNLRNP